MSMSHCPRCNALYLLPGSVLLNSGGICGDCRAILLLGGWRRWFGGEPPVQPHEPITVDWGSYRRTYERADMVAWQNLPADGRYLWRDA